MRAGAEGGSSANTLVEVHRGILYPATGNVEMNKAALGGFILGMSFMGVFFVHAPGLQYFLLTIKIVGMLVGAYLIADAQITTSDKDGHL